MKNILLFVVVYRVLIKPGSTDAPGRTTGNQQMHDSFVTVYSRVCISWDLTEDLSQK